MNRKKRQAAEKQNNKQELPPDQALSLAIGMHQQGQLSDAAILYRSILEVIPDQPDALHYLGVLLHQTGESEAGIEMINRSISVNPDYTDAHNNLGNVFKEKGQLQQAAAAYRKVIDLNPKHADALNNLGIVLKDLREFDEAIAVFHRAIEHRPNSSDTYQNLGNCFRKQGDFDQAIAAYRKAIALKPYNAEAYKHLSRTLYLGRKDEEAIQLLKQWLEFDPENPVALHTLAAYSSEKPPDRASDAYVQQTFDGFAGSFDYVLKRLDYKAPFLVKDALRAACSDQPRKFDILDAGCGTGLCGPLIKSFASSLIGVDLSSAMLDKARGRKVYDQLIQAELTDYLQNSRNAFDLILSADTFCYFGDLIPIFQACFTALKASGMLIYTVEKDASEDNGSDYQLAVHGRYLHTRQYVRQVMQETDFTIDSIESAILRSEAGNSVSGIVVTARK